MISIRMRPLQMFPAPAEAGQVGPDDPVDLLLACHMRIRHFGQLASALPGAQEAGAADVIDAAQRLHRYFTVALPLHVADEDESVRPRLDAHAPPPGLRDAMEAMTPTPMPMRT